MKKLHLNWDGSLGSTASCNKHRKSKVQIRDHSVDRDLIYCGMRFIDDCDLVYEGKVIDKTDPRLCQMCLKLIFGGWHMPYEKDDYCIADYL